MMFGYATIETDNYMPLALDIAHALLIELAAIRRENTDIKYLRPMPNRKLHWNTATITSLSV